MHTKHFTDMNVLYPYVTTAKNAQTYLGGELHPMEKTSYKYMELSRAPTENGSCFVICNVKVVCLLTKHLGARKLVKTCSYAPDLIGIWKCWFLRRAGLGKTGVPGQKPLRARTRTDNKLNPHMTKQPGIEPGPHWWEATLSPLHHPCSPQICSWLR